MSELQDEMSWSDSGWMDPAPSPMEPSNPSPTPMKSVAARAIVGINNAAATQRKPFLESGPADWAPQVDVTVTGTLRITHAVARGMAAR